MLSDMDKNPYQIMEKPTFLYIKIVLFMELSEHGELRKCAIGDRIFPKYYWKPDPIDFPIKS